MNAEPIAAARKLTKHSIEHLTSPNSDCENGSDGGPPSSPKKTKDHSEKVVSYTEMIAKAIFATPNNMSTLAEIYSFLIVKYPILNSRGKSWKNSVRHTLSLNEWFIKIPKLDNAKCCYWSVHPVYIQRFRRGDFQKQRKASVTKLRSHNTHRYFDFGYDISPTLADYHFMPPPAHFQDVGPAALSPHGAFSPWPAAITRPFEEFPPNFLPPVTPQYPSYPIYTPPTSFGAFYPEHEESYINYRTEATHAPYESMKHNIRGADDVSNFYKHYNTQTSQRQQLNVDNTHHHHDTMPCRTTSAQNTTLTDAPYSKAQSII